MDRMIVQSCCSGCQGNSQNGRMNNTKLQIFRRVHRKEPCKSLYEDIWKCEANGKAVRRCIASSNQIEANCSFFLSSKLLTFSKSIDGRRLKLFLCQLSDKRSLSFMVRTASWETLWMIDPDSEALCILLFEDKSWDDSEKDESLLEWIDSRRGKLDLLFSSFLISSIGFGVSARWHVCWFSFY